ncbi:MAG TPA: GNAT family N-acetyltransferase [Ktedonobacterales bacterium]|nr:GNAT family N-acetyltransferase [Ktedonobacterales bacterium]
MSAETDFNTITIRDNAAERRYETRIGDSVAVLEYEREGDRSTLIHTGVPRELEGHGIAGKLARFALDDARTHGWQVVPECSYVQSYLRRHPDQMDVVAPDARDLVTGDERP